MRWTFFTKNIFKMMLKGQRYRKGFSSPCCSEIDLFSWSMELMCASKKHFIFFYKYVNNMLLKYLEFSRW